MNPRCSCPYHKRFEKENDDDDASKGPKEEDPEKDPARGSGKTQEETEASADDGGTGE